MNDNNYFVKGHFIVREVPKQTLLKNSFTKLIFYWLYNILAHILLFFKRVSLKKKTFRYNVSICVIFKNEADFLEEWLTYHIVVGVQHFYLYNNNSDDNFLDILQPFIDDGIVELIDWPYNQAQMSAYEDCYKKNKDSTEWLGFIDIDEFVCPIYDVDMKDFLRTFENYPGVAIYWKQFGSTGHLKHDNNKLVIEQYTQNWNKPSIFTKMFCNMNYEIGLFENPHIISTKICGVVINPVNQFKKIIKFGFHRKSYFDKDTIQINHYWGKAYNIFVKSKLQRSDVYHANSDEMSELRKKLLKSHEEMCTTRDYTIQRFLLSTKLKINNIK